MVSVHLGLIFTLVYHKDHFGNFVIFNIRDLSNQSWSITWNSILIKFYFKTFWHWTYVQNTLAYYCSFYFKLFICPPDVKGQKFSRGFTPWTPNKAPLWTFCRAYSTLRPLPEFCNIQKLNLSSNTGISKTPWINP